ncbi:MAG: hypothetical protein PHW10_01760 [Candidatus Peribacteraceae bacterium]|nr:hypothetical protein [Candidatus Peribacteraceae bacterium]
MEYSLRTRVTFVAGAVTVSVLLFTLLIGGGNEDSSSLRLLALTTDGSEAYTCPNGGTVEVLRTFLIGDNQNQPISQQGETCDTVSKSIATIQGDRVYLSGGSGPPHATDDRLVVTGPRGSLSKSYDVGCELIQPQAEPYDITSIVRTASQGNVNATITATFSDVCGLYCGHTAYYIDVVRCAAPASSSLSSLPSAGSSSSWSLDISCPLPILCGSFCKNDAYGILKCKKICGNFSHDPFEHLCPSGQMLDRFDCSADTSAPCSYQCKAVPQPTGGGGGGEGTSSTGGGGAGASSTGGGGAGASSTGGGGAGASSTGGGGGGTSSAGGGASSAGDGGNCPPGTWEYCTMSLPPHCECR